MAERPQLELAKFLKQQGRRGVIRAKTFIPTAAQEAKFQRIINRLIKEWTGVLKSTVIPEYANAIAQSGSVGSIGLLAGSSEPVDRLERALELGAARTTAFAASTAPELEVWAQEYAKWHLDKLTASIRQATGVEIQPALSLPDTNSLLRAATRRNVALIQGLDGDMKKRVTQAVIDSFNDRKAVNALRKRLVDDLGFAPGRARIIAQDQIGKYTKELDQFRHTQLGIEKYVWVTVGDDRVRPTHAANEGKIFAWSKPPAATGHPGDDINCRCRAMAYIEPDNA